MIPILLCSVVTVAIVAERFWTLQRKRIVPDNLVVEVWQRAKKGRLSEEHLHVLRKNSPLGKVLAAGLVNRQHSREIMKESIEEAGRHVVHSMEQYLNTLGTIAAIAPLLGLLGTVIGMIKVFAVITTQGIGDPGVLASGISEALITTAAGLSVAIPSLIFYRYFRGKVEDFVITMEQEALKMVEALAGERERERYSSAEHPNVSAPRVAKG
ncbi:MAG: MotA/TolQ/ExbB proton channel family protein [Gammaproteobacteria bacterium]|nr:MotA/TolQ/ExbB proton channel family protein [Gammaproteobacteria bacterium]